MSEYAPSPCFYCKHFNEADHERLTCRAYPDGIPEEFIKVTAKHLEVRGDEEARVAFEKRTGLLPAEERLLEAGLAVPEPKA